MLCRYTLAQVHLALGVGFTLPSASSAIRAAMGYPALVRSLGNLQQASGSVLSATVCSPVLDALAAGGRAQSLSWPSSVSGLSQTLGRILAELHNRIRVQVGGGRL
jgi:hypothetical protein